MAVSELRKKTVFLLISIAIITLVLIIIPNDDTIKTHLATYLGLTFDQATGKLTNTDATMNSQVGVTAIFLLINVLHIVKVILGMTIVIMLVRYVNYLIFHLVLRNSSQNEISSLLKTVLSI